MSAHHFHLGSVGQIVCGAFFDIAGLSNVHNKLRIWAQQKKLFTLLDLCVSSLRRGHANLLCIVPILTDDPRRESENGLTTCFPTPGTEQAEMI